MASVLGITASYLSQLESGHRPVQNWIMQLVNGLEFELERLGGSVWHLNAAFRGAEMETVIRLKKDGSTHPDQSLRNEEIDGSWPLDQLTHEKLVNLYGYLVSKRESAPVVAQPL